MTDTPKKSDNNSLDKAVYGLEGAGKQADQYNKTTQAIAEHVGREYGHSLKMLVLKGREPTFDKPVYPTSGSAEEKAIWSKEYDRLIKKTEKYEEDKAKVFNLILGQCEKPMKNRVEAVEEYEDIEDGSDVVKLLQSIKEIAYQSSDKKYPPMQAWLSLKALMNISQKSNEDLRDYYKRFEGVVEMAELSYGVISPVENAKKTKDYAKSKSAAIEKERDKVLAYIFMQGADRQQYGSLMYGLGKDHSLGNDNYPASVEEALEVLTMNTKKMKKTGTNATKANGDSLELAFAQMDKKEARKKGICYKCLEKWSPGHKCGDKKGGKQENGAAQHMMTWME